MTSIVQYERDFHIHAIPGDTSVFNDNLLFFDPSAFDVRQGFRRSGDAVLNGVFKTLGRLRRDFCNFCNSHVVLLFRL